MLMSSTMSSQHAFGLFALLRYFPPSALTRPRSSTSNRLCSASQSSVIAALANDAEQFSGALAVPNADWVYVRFLPSRELVDAANQAKKRVFIAGPTVSGNVPKNWRHAAEVGIDAILTDFPLELDETFRQSTSRP